MDLKLNPLWVGSKVVLRLKQSEVVGVVTQVFPSSLMLRDVEMDGQKLSQYRVQARDLVSVHVIAPADTSSSKAVPPQPADLEKFACADLPRNIGVHERAKKAKEVPAHLRSVRNDIDIGILTNRKPMPTISDQNGHSLTNANDDDFDIDYIFVDEVGDALFRAVENIQCEKEIAISVLGEKVVSRHGTPCIFAVASGCYVFLFDLLALGKAAFVRKGSEGPSLCDILESDRVKKVVHNCQGLADVLAHVYGVSLSNVDDTLAFAANEHYGREGYFSKYVYGLPHLLAHFLDVKPSHIYFPRVREGMNVMPRAIRPITLQRCVVTLTTLPSVNDEAIWRDRPLPNHLLMGAAKTVVHLVRLRDELIERALTRARQGSLILLDCLRCEEDDTAANRSIDVPNLLPPQFRKLDNIRCKPRGEKKFLESVDGGSADPYVHFTRDMQKLSVSRQTRSASSLRDFDRRVLGPYR